jgi:2-keto-4-pentenoate hydratase/2-oxohepta-3-ene-1,7-dioic acid hydratase in catechol pathway
MRLLSFAVGDYVSFGAVSGDAIVDVGRLFSERYPTLGSVLRAGELHRAMALGGSSKATIALDEIRYLPPVTDPEKIICIGINYGNRNAEYKDGAEAPQYPSVFMRTPGSLVGHLEPILNPPESNQLDYEGEIVLVIGKGGRRIAAADAWQHVAGLTLMNEGSVRDWLRHSKFNVTPGKNFERSGSLGPWLVTADELEPDGELHLMTRVNGELRQDDTTANLIFNFDYLLSYITTFTTLKPGDMIVSGTPTGAGARFDPPKWLKPGDVVEVTVPEIGTLRNGVEDGL